MKPTQLIAAAKEARKRARIAQEKAKAAAAEAKAARGQAQEGKLKLKQTKRQTKAARKSARKAEDKAEELQKAVAKALKVARRAEKKARKAIKKRASLTLSQKPKSQSAARHASLRPKAASIIRVASGSTTRRPNSVHASLKPPGRAFSQAAHTKLADTARATPAGQVPSSPASS